MPSSEYGSVVGGGLKLKGAKDAGVKKHKKKESKTDTGESNLTADSKKEQQLERAGVDEALAEEEEKGHEEGTKQQEAEVKEFGKTEAERRHEARRKKRVRISHMSPVVLVAGLT